MGGQCGGIYLGNLVEWVGNIWREHFWGRLILLKSEGFRSNSIVFPLKGGLWGRGTVVEADGEVAEGMFGRIPFDG